MVLGKLFIHKPERPSGRRFHGGEFNGSQHSSTGWDIAAEHADAWGVHKSVKGLGKSNRYSNLHNVLLQVTESAMRAPSSSRNSAARTASFANDVAAGRYKAKPFRVFKFEEIREAHRVMEANQAKGKMVVVVDGH
jgi:NADPH:quinone reductase-like Zn-dependent oxidoreductase